MNGKLIAVWGSPGAGVSTFCAALAKGLSRYFNYLLLCSADPFVPANALWNVLSGTEKAGSELGQAESIREILSCPDLNADYIKARVSPHPNIRQLGLLGCFVREQYEQCDPVNGNAANTFFSCVRQFSQITIVDCMQPQLDTLSLVAMEQADMVITLLEPNAYGLAFTSAQRRILSSLSGMEHTYIAAKVAPTTPMAAFEVSIGFHFDGLILPYTQEVRNRLEQLELFGKYGGQYGKTVDSVVDRIRRDADEQSFDAGPIQAAI